MTTLRKFTSGSGAPANVLNEIIKRTEENRQKIDKLLRVSREFDTPKPDKRFVARSFERRFDPLASLDNEIAWEQVLVKNDGTFEVPDPIKRDSRGTIIGAPDDFRFPGFVLTPPNGLVQAMTDETGRKQYAWISVPSVIMSTIVSVTGGPNATYEIGTVDETILIDNLTPIDRWSGVSYVARIPGDPCLMLLTDRTVAGVKMVAFETPEFAQCPPFTASGVSSSSFIGL